MVKKENVLLDWRHWLGWLLTVFVITFIFYYFDRGFFSNPFAIFLIFSILFGVVVVDYFKHMMRLQ